MEKTNDNSNFFVGRLKSFKYAAKGGWMLLTSEHSIITQIIIGVIMTIIGFFVGLNQTEWLFQILAIAILIIAEASNTAVEYLCDFVHPEHHKKIGEIKDIAAGIPFLAAIFSIIIGLIIYIPKFIA